MSVHKITNRQDFESNLTENELVFVKWGASFCKPCKSIQPMYEQLAEVNKEFAKFLLIEIDDQHNENQDEIDELCDKYTVSSIPLFQVFKNGKLFGKLLGGNVNTLKSFVSINIRKNNFQEMYK